MDFEYLNYISGDSPFYQPITIKDHSHKEIGLEKNPRGWFSDTYGPWQSWRPPEVRIPIQGWKIHVSATCDNALRILNAVSKICIKGKVPFKFIATFEQLIMLNSKNANRSSSGKFITVYPQNGEQLTDIVKSVESEIGGLPGPYILSDARYRAGPIYFRYGGFRLLSPLYGVDGENPQIIDAKGFFIPDLRLPYFQSPHDVETPEVINDAVKERSSKSHGFHVRQVFKYQSTPFFQ